MINSVVDFYSCSLTNLQIITLHSHTLVHFTKIFTKHIDSTIKTGYLVNSSGGNGIDDTKLMELMKGNSFLYHGTNSHRHSTKLEEKLLITSQKLGVTVENAKARYSNLIISFGRY